ncbi:hypothetical protein PILCRDRAFT_112491 [Piloderma croceum F 1598]|uniref:Uncharacterized protein n=1 Tax=Piloderma croceum (strain F 1598) TaxID=765440 RepID=A0A0C3GKL9_PILCF|nr:hypothetical protein PILCRDRAFT_112491 [Piloderma croceum F 1598]
MSSKGLGGGGIFTSKREGVGPGKMARIRCLFFMKYKYRTEKSMREYNDRRTIVFASYGSASSTFLLQFWLQIWRGSLYFPLPTKTICRLRGSFTPGRSSTSWSLSGIHPEVAIWHYSPGISWTQNLRTTLHLGAISANSLFTCVFERFSTPGYQEGTAFRI